MKNTNTDFDLFVIGAGSGGVRAARLASQSGAKVCIAESDRIGGTCVIRGCVPKKFFSYSSKFSKHNTVAKSYGWHHEETTFSWDKLMENKNKQIEKLSNIYRSNLEKAGVKIFELEARIIGSNIVRLSNGDEYYAKKILIATGAKPNFPNIKGVNYGISSDDFFELETLPQKIIVVGGGYIALEFSSIISGLGRKCDLLYRGDKLLKGFDQDISRIITQELQSEKCNVRLNTDVIEITKNKNQFEVLTTNGERLEADLVLFATGRLANIDCINKDLKIKINPNNSVCVNKKYQTTIPSIYAVGDVSNSDHLTPVAIREAMIFARNEFEKDNGNYVIENIPTAVFSSPEIGTVGLNEDQALKKYKKIDIYTSSFRPLYYTLSDINIRTYIKLIINNKSQRLIGFHMVGDDAAEITQIISTLINKKIKKSDLDNTIPLHPSTSEEIMTMRDMVTKEI